MPIQVARYPFPVSQLRIGRDGVPVQPTHAGVRVCGQPRKRPVRGMRGEDRSDIAGRIQQRGKVE